MDTSTALQRAITALEENGLQDDPRYKQLLVIRAKQKKSSLNTQQLEHLRAQIFAYRQLCRSLPVNKKMMALALGKKPPVENVSAEEVVPAVQVQKVTGKTT